MARNRDLGIVVRNVWTLDSFWLRRQVCLKHPDILPKFATPCPTIASPGLPRLFTYHLHLPISFFSTTCNALYLLL